MSTVYPWEEFAEIGVGEFICDEQHLVHKLLVDDAGREQQSEGTGMVVDLCGVPYHYLFDLTL
jgi:hypothetical protein